MKNSLRKRTFCLSAGILVLLFFLCGAGASAQDKDVSNGIRFGYQNANMIKNSELGENDLNSFYVGYARKIKLIPLFYVETGLEYLRAGADRIEQSKLELHYLTLPAQAALKLGPFILQGGVNGNFKIAENQDRPSDATDLTSSSSEFFDITANGGVGLKIFFITFEARYYWGLLDVNNGWQNQYWQTGLKLNF